MKRLLILLFAFLSVCVVAQESRIVNKPSVLSQSTSIFDIMSIELSDTATIFTIDVNYPKDRWFRLAKETSLVANEVKYRVKWSEGLVLGKETYLPKSGELQIRLGFEPLPKDYKVCDFIEPGDGGFSLYDIDISAEGRKYVIPKEIMGNYCLTDGSAMWEIGLYPSVVAYCNDFWYYEPNQVIGKLKLRNRTDKSKLQTLYYKQKGDDLLVGTTKENMKLLTKEQILGSDYELPKKLQEDWNQDKFLTSGKAVLRGYFDGYSPKLGFSRASLLVRNAFKSKDEQFLVKINPDGTFEKEIELDYPVEVGLSFSNKYLEIAMCPGDTITTYYSLKDLFTVTSQYRFCYTTTRYMGETGLLNTQFTLFKLSQEYYDGLDNFKTMNVAEYDKNNKEHAIKVRQEIVDFTSKHKLMPKAQSYIKSETLLKLAMDRLDYGMQRAYFVSKDTSLKKEEIPVEFIAEGINQLDMNDKSLMISGEYYFFINRLEFATFHNYIESKFTYTLNYLEGKTGDKMPRELESFVDSLYRGYSREMQKTDSLGFINNMKKMAEFEQKYKQYRSAYETKYICSAFERCLGQGQSFTRDAVLTSSVLHTYKRINYKIDDTDFAYALSPISDVNLIKAIIECRDENHAKFAPKSEVEKEVVSVSKKAEVKDVSAKGLLADLLKPYRGNVVVLDFWAMWCGPCRSGMLKSYILKDKLKGKKVKFVYFTTEKNSPKEEREKFIKENEITGEFLTISTDNWSELGSLYNISGIPRYMLIDKNGNVVDKVFDTSKVDEITKLLE